MPSPLGLAVNFLLIESLQRFYQYYGDDLKVYYTPVLPVFELITAAPLRLSVQQAVETT
jgi:hypothetical protein